MDSSNHWYGHAHIWARYCGLDPARPPRINGVIQHGWTFVHGFGYGHAPPDGFVKYVWSDKPRRRGQAIGWRDYYVTGAPLLYLMAMEPEDPDFERAGTIWYPFHAALGFEQVLGDHRGLIEDIKATESGPVTICLYEIEFADEQIRGLYRDAGFRVICHGARGTYWRGGDTEFLQRQLSELRRHQRVASNRLSTAIFYGIAAGCEPAVYGDPMDLVGVRAGFNGKTLLTRTFRELHGPRIDLAVARRIADDELGVGWLAGPEELKLMLGWEHR